MTSDFKTRLLDETPDAVIAMSPEGRVLHWNRAAEALFGYSEAVAVGNQLTELIVPADSVEQERQILVDAMARGLVVYEGLRRHRDGYLVNVSVATKAIRDASGNVEFFVSTKMDVTHLKILRDAKLMEGKFGDLLESMPDAIVMVNVTGRIVLVNSQAEQVFGFRRAELLGQPVELLLPTRFRAAHLGHRSVFFGAPRRRMMGAGRELSALRKNGEEFPVEVSLSPLETEEGTMVMSAIRDVTERKQFEQSLRQTNEELSAKAKLLAERNAEIERKNIEVEQARRTLEEKGAELALTTKYKSEFLANMSHELRTPLNSVLILGQQLANNAEGNLTPKQVEYAQTIYGAGTDLLSLISEILDLSKIESGTVAVEMEELVVAQLLETVSRMFRQDAENRRLSFDVELDPQLNRSLVSDPKRLQQVLRNLLSNAFKFTANGGVRLKVWLATKGWSADHPVLPQSAAVVAFEVSDTGIGIPPEKHRLIFEAFQQADSSTSRKYGGTGLGLAISRELAHLLGGEIQLRSVPGEGSTFTLFLPQAYAGSAISLRKSDNLADGLTERDFDVTHQAVRKSERPDPIADDRHNLRPDDAVLLIVEDDPHYSGVLVELARGNGFKALVATRGADAIALAKEFHPTAISLDVFLPDMLGWTVLSQLKMDPSTRHIPIQIVSLDEARQHSLPRGAFSFVTKPTTTEGLDAAMSRIREFSTPLRKRLLVVEDDTAEQLSIQALLGHGDIDIVTADTGESALSMLRKEPIDCVVLDLRLPDMSGFEVLEQLKNDEQLRDVPQEMLSRLIGSDDDLVGKQVLVVDDDVRNIFALSSVLERRGMKVLTANTGRDAIATLEATPSLSIVLMDIMMAEMDGYQTMQVIRQNAALRRLPIIALTAKAMTAKAMKGDREKCLEAGASDYLAKPVNTEQLLSALRMWLHR